MFIHMGNFVFQAGDVAFRDSSITDITRKQKNVIKIKIKKSQNLKCTYFSLECSVLVPHALLVLHYNSLMAKKLSYIT